MSKKTGIILPGGDDATIFPLTTYRLRAQDARGDARSWHAFPGCPEVHFNRKILPGREKRCREVQAEYT